MITLPCEAASVDIRLAKEHHSVLLHSTLLPLHAKGTNLTRTRKWPTGDSSRIPPNPAECVAHASYSSSTRVSAIFLDMRYVNRSREEDLICVNVYEWNYYLEVPPAREIEDSKDRVARPRAKERNDDFILLLFEGIASASSHFTNNTNNIIIIDSFKQCQ